MSMISTATKPIFVIGTGRCGSTIFHQIFSYHSQVAWLSRTCEMYPQHPHRNYLAMRLLDAPLPQKYLRKLIYPVEAYNFWDNYCYGFGEPMRDLLKEDVLPITKKRLQKVMASMLTENRARLLIKITGWSRIGFLKEIFPDAKFIHIYRDGRAVVNSWLNVDWWQGWHGPHHWQWGQLSPQQEQLWHRHNQSFVALGGILWDILMTATDKAKELIPPEDYLEIRYEDFCQQPVKLFQQAVDFCDLAWSSEFETAIHSFKMESADYKWKEQLTLPQQQILNASLRDALQRYGYE